MAGVVESMFGATVPLVLEKFASHAIKEAGAFLGFNEDLNKMKDTLTTINTFLADAERQVEIKGDNVLLKKWLAGFKSITYEADNVLDEIQYEWLKQEVDDHNQVWKKLSSLKTKCKYSRRIWETQKKMDNISDLADQYNLERLNVPARGNLEIAPERVTTSLMGDEKVIGRDDKKTEVIQQLMSEHEGVQVLTIYGIGGVGKTTLARYVYNDDVIQNHFELKPWVCVSDNFDVKRLTSEILNSVLMESKKSNTRLSSEKISLDQLQKALMEELTRKKFILVLDDVWNKEQQKWDQFKKPFVTAGGISKSKILVTTRSREIVEMMSSMKPINELEGLSPDDFWNLFKRYAFDGSNSGNNDETLEKIGKEIVKKLKGSPLAAKTVGRLLKSNMSVKHWNDILNSELWKLSEEKDNIMPALRLSYQHLPGALKPCFAFLCLFPKDYQYEERMLKELWIANGFIFPQGSEPLEDTATTYINTLLSMCMIQIVKHDDMLGPFDLSEREFVVHDLLHDLAQIISKDEYFHIRSDADLKNIPDNVHHLNISSEVTSSKLNNFKSTFNNLRTIVVRDSTISPPSCFNNNGLHGICIEAKHMRALVMSCMRVAEPLSKCQLKHLRYLDLSYTNISCLPESLCSFYNLQVLNVEGCDELKKFPIGIIKLVNLRHLYTSGRNISTSSIKNVRKLTSLQELCFHVSKGVGHTVAELENMNDIHELEIEYLENVSSKEEAIKARLNDKKHLVSLTLKWSSEITDRIPYDGILFGLQPYKYLRILEIYNYGGAEFPPWEENENGSLPTLQKFVLDTCLNLHTLKSLEHPELQHLEIEYCPKLKKIPLCKAPKLPWLKMSSCEELSLDSGFDGLDSLENLEIYNCPALWDDMVMKTWILPSSLKKLTIEVGRNPPLFTHDELVAFMSKSFENLTSLKSLWIHGLHHVTEFNGKALQHMTSLTSLIIKNLMNLVSMDIRTLTSLEGLEIWGCNKIKSLSGSILPPSLQDFEVWNCEMIESMTDFGLLPSLRVLKFAGCSNLESLLENINHLPSLETLKIENCPKIKSLPANGLPPSLRILYIRSCPLLVSVDIQTLTTLEELRISECNKIKSLLGSILPPSLQDFSISNCEMIKSMPDFGLLPSLFSLRLRYCSNLESLPENLNHLPSLEYLCVWYCPKIKSFSGCGLPPSLRRLDLRGCSNLESLPENLNHLPSLETLSVSFCPKIKSLPANGLPPSLHWLDIYECPLLKESCQKDVGSDWPKISNIPEVKIDQRWLRG